MKTVVEAREVNFEVVEPKHEIEVVCSSCKDPVSAQEEATGVCTNCGEGWAPKQSVKIWATSVPWASGGVM
jgi:formylmethanofuran dehydrogenase subunit E